MSLLIICSYAFLKGLEILLDLTIGDFALRMLTGTDVFAIPENLKQGTVSVFSLSDQAEGVIERGLLYSFGDEPLNKDE